MARLYSFRSSCAACATVQKVAHHECDLQGSGMLYRDQVRTRSMTPIPLRASLYLEARGDIRSVRMYHRVAEITRRSAVLQRPVVSAQYASAVWAAEPLIPDPLRAGVVSGQPRSIEEFETLPPLLSRPLALKRGRRRFLDALRGWLLMPGHLELLTWIVGVCLLLVLTAVLIWLFSVSWSYHLLQVKGIVT